MKSVDLSTHKNLITEKKLREKELIPHVKRMGRRDKETSQRLPLGTAKKKQHLRLILIFLKHFHSQFS